MVFEHLSALLSDADRYSMLLIERAVVGLLRLCLIVAEKVIFIYHSVYATDLKTSSQPSMRDQLYVALDALGGLPPRVLNAVAEQVLAGLVLVVQRRQDIIRLVHFTQWPEFTLS